MKPLQRYSANYARVNAHFVLQNLQPVPPDNQTDSLVLVLKNILQRGNPTLLSQFLKAQIGTIDLQPEFQLLSQQTPQWHRTILGDEEHQYFPARQFYYDIIPRYFGDYAFIQQLLLPEVPVLDILQKDIPTLREQRVDFYLPLARLVIEIDGAQHLNGIDAHKDKQRNTILKKHGFKTIRISTAELNEAAALQVKIKAISQHLAAPSIRAQLEQYRAAQLPPQVLQATAIIRLQILLLELLQRQQLQLEQEWQLNLILSPEEDLGDFAELAVADLQLWLQQLYLLRHKKQASLRQAKIRRFFSRKEAPYTPGWINIDFSVLQRWTDEADLHPDLLFVRADYWEQQRNFFRVSTGPLIDYHITDQDREPLTFFLQNIFDKEDFREGQLPIINNVLNRRDTIGLLPTGGGKSLCYQLPSLLQPGVSFVVCPIKSLMQDQKRTMDEAFINHTQLINSDQSPQEKEQVQAAFAKKQYLLIWISPERFQIKTFRQYLQQLSNQTPVAHAVIDEVHCLSEWGHDFRTAYLNLGRSIERFCPGARYIGLTATASINVLKDIRVEFGRKQTPVDEGNVLSLLDYSRPELDFEVVETQNALHDLKDYLKQFQVFDQQAKAALVFTPTVNGLAGCFHLANSLNTVQPAQVKWYSGEVPKIKSHADGQVIKVEPLMPPDEFKRYKARVQQEFQENQFPVMVATKAFGMGIDKGNIHYTFHYGLPGSVESLYQEAGRAGRWDKKDPDLAHLQARCKILYTKENAVGQPFIDKLFDIETPFQRIKEIIEKVKWEGKDIFRQFFLFSQGQLDSQEWVRLLSMMIKAYYPKPGSKTAKVTIYYSDCVSKMRKLGFEGRTQALTDLAEKAIYKLSILGIVRDWTKDFISHFEVVFQPSNQDTVFAALQTYLRKYEPQLDLRAALEQLDEHLSPTRKCIWYLQDWTFRQIIYNRKQSLKTLVDWCNDFPELGNEGFKERLNSYFRFNETTFKYQHLAEHPEDYEHWFAVFYLAADTPAEPERYIFDLHPEDAQRKAMIQLRDGLSRFLETYANNTGLNFISGLLRLYTGDFQNTDGRPRFRAAWTDIQTRFSLAVQKDIVERTLELCSRFPAPPREDLGLFLLEYYPEQAVYFAERLDVPQILDQAIRERLQRLQQLNHQLQQTYEQIGKI